MRFFTLFTVTRTYVGDFDTVTRYDLTGYGAIALGAVVYVATLFALLA